MYNNYPPLVTTPLLVLSQLHIRLVSWTPQSLQLSTCRMHIHQNDQRTDAFETATSRYQRPQSKPHEPKRTVRDLMQQGTRIKRNAYHTMLNIHYIYKATSQTLQWYHHTNTTEWWASVALTNHDVPSAQNNICSTSFIINFGLSVNLHTLLYFVSFLYMLVTRGIIVCPLTRNRNVNRCSSLDFFHQEIITDVARTRKRRTWRANKQDDICLKCRGRFRIHFMWKF